MLNSNERIKKKRKKTPQDNTDKIMASLRQSKREKNNSTPSRNNRNESKYIDVTNAALCDIVYLIERMYRRKENEIERVILITMGNDFRWWPLVN